MRVYFQPSKIYRFGPFKTSEIEIQDLFKAWLALSVAFAILIGGNIFSVSFAYNFALAGITVGIGFLLHELGHKILAQYYGCFAEFRSFDIMLVLAIAMAFVGFIFAAPGAVMIQGKVSKDKNGKISLAGPLMSLTLAIIFVAILWIQIPDLAQMSRIFETSSQIFTLKWSYLVCFIGAKINAFIALFNMLPFAILDGKKIFAWNKMVYFTMLAVTILMMILVF